jgi:uncharacterized protein
MTRLRAAVPPGLCLALLSLALLSLALLSLAVLGAGAARADEYGGNPARAAKHNDAEAVREMLAGGAGNPNETDDSDRTALHYGALDGNLEIVAILIKAGARLDVTDGLGNTPLHLAAERSQTEAGELLLAAGAPVDPQNHDGMTPLMIAASRGDTQLVLALVAKGASTALTDYTGRDALAWAQDDNHPAAAVALRRAAGSHGP